MDIFRTTFIGFEEQLIIQKNVCENNGVKELSDYAQKEDMMAAKFG